MMRPNGDDTSDGYANLRFDLGGASALLYSLERLTGEATANHRMHHPPLACRDDGSRAVNRTG